MSYFNFLGVPARTSGAQFARRLAENAAGLFWGQEQITRLPDGRLNRAARHIVDLGVRLGAVDLSEQQDGLLPSRLRAAQAAVGLVSSELVYEIALRDGESDRQPGQAGAFVAWAHEAHPGLRDPITMYRTGLELRPQGMPGVHELFVAARTDMA